MGKFRANLFQAIDRDLFTSDGNRTLSAYPVLVIGIGVCMYTSRNVVGNLSQ